MRALDLNNLQGLTNKLVEEPDLRRRRGRMLANIKLGTPEWARQMNEYWSEDGRRKLSLLNLKRRSQTPTRSSLMSILTLP